MSTEQTLPTFNVSEEYLDKDALLTVRPFATTMKHGYISEDVDVYVEEAFNHTQDLVNKYNDLVWRAGQKIEELQGIIRTLEEENEALQNATPEYSYTEEEVTPEETVTYEEDVYEEPVVEQTVAEEPVEDPTPVNEVRYASERAQQIMSVAAEEASEHVRRALEKVAAIETEAEDAASSLVENAQKEATSIVVTAHEEAEDIKANAVTESAEALEKLEKAKVETTALFERITAFHTFQLEQVQNLREDVLPTPVVEPADEEEDIINLDDEDYVTLPEDEEEIDLDNEYETVTESVTEEEVPTVEEEVAYDYNTEEEDGEYVSYDETPETVEEPEETIEIVENEPEYLSVATETIEAVEVEPATEEGDEDNYDPYAPNRDEENY